MDDELEQALAQAEETVDEEVSAVLDEVADEFAHEVEDATELVAARFSVSRIARMFTDRMPRIVRRLLRVSEEAAEHTADVLDTELPDGWDDLPARYGNGTLPEPVRAYVDTTEHLLRAVGDRLADTAVRELNEGIAAGENVEDLRARLRAAFAREGAQLGNAREERIARTEAGRAWNTATLEAARAVEGPDRPVVKQWISRGDSRVRDDHAHANGQIQLLDDPFTIGGILMDAPHDPNAPASQVVNCRCVLAVYPETRAAFFESQDHSAAGFSEARRSSVEASVTADADGSHLGGSMIALVPSEDDAERLALTRGEDASELHLTLHFLGDGSAWTDTQRQELIDNMRAMATELGGPVHAFAFGVNHWNPGGEDPCWVWAVGDDRDSPGGTPSLEDARRAATAVLEGTRERPELPAQHSPWHAHVTGVYSGEEWPLREMRARLGPIRFDRLRVAFAGDHTDIPLAPQEELSMPEATAAALPVRTWSTPGRTAIAFENQQTGDGRVFTPGALYWDRDPMPLQYADEMLMGHQGAELAGAIQAVIRDGDRITAGGVLYPFRPAGADAVQLLDEEAPLGVSVDLDDVDVEFVDKTLSEEDEDWLFASARLPSASVFRMEDGSVVLSGATTAEWAASDGVLSRNRYDLQLISGPGGVLTASSVHHAFAGTGLITAAAGDADDLGEGVVVHRQTAGELVMRITRARLRGATLVAMPAFKDARIILDAVVASAAAPAPVVAASGDTRERVVAYVRSSPAAVGARDVAAAIGITMQSARGYLARAAKAGQIVRLAPGLYVGPSSMPEGEISANADSRIAESGQPASSDDLDAEVIASAWEAVQSLPPMPAAWFAAPTPKELPPGSKGVHYDQGRIYGWVAQAGEPHAGMPGRNLTIESLGEIDLTHFLRQEFNLDDGSVVRAGAFTMNVGHHRDGAECETSSCQFDDSRTVAGVVTVGLNEGGMWFAGAGAPWLSEWDRTVFAACQPSYHMRQGRDGRWQLRAVLSVPVPGHSSPLLAAAVERSNLALAASAAAATASTDSMSGQDTDTSGAESGTTGVTAADQGGHRPDAVSGQPDRARDGADVPSVLDAVAATLTSPVFLDRLAAAVDDRRRERADMDAEIERLAAQMDPAITDLAADVFAGAASKGDQ